ncbi:hypothetical protein J5500_01110 [Candidatus Saccharibacteria bacterium]|nr:hypothetical protein [Candidatus Saccharibacteria bacterium]
MSHKSGILTGPEPTEVEQKTAAELEDEKRPAAMAVSESMFDLAETDDRPAIEQKTAKGVIFAQADEKAETDAAKATGARNFQIDASFAAEMHEREAKEKAERKKRMEARAKADAEEQKKRNQEISEKLKEAQTLDPEEIKDEQTEAAHAENLEKLYPDPVPTMNDVEDALWRKRTDKGAQIAGRAKLDSIYDSELHKGIVTASIFGILGLGLQLVSNYAGSFFPNFIRVILFVASIIAYIYSYWYLRKVSKKYRNKKIPSDQENTFTLASLLPFMALRTVIMEIFGGLPIPIVGGIFGTLIGVMVGSSLHYSFLFKFQIEASDKIVILNTSLYIFIAVLPNIIQYMNSPSTGSTEMLNGFSWLIQAAIFLIGERVAAKLAPGHFNK